MTTQTIQQIQTEAIDSETAGRKPFRWAGMEPAPSIDSYSDVPWFRRNEIALFPIFLPLMIVVIATGDLFYRANPRMKEYSGADVWRFKAWAKVFFLVLDAITVWVLADAFLV